MKRFSEYLLYVSFVFALTSALIFCGSLLLSLPAIAQETVTLTTPEAVPSNLTYRVERLTIQVDDPNTVTDEGVLTVQLMGVERPSAVSCVYSSSTSPTATFLINALNKANLSSAYAGNATTGSLKQRIYHRLVVMNEAIAVCGRGLVGSLTGTVP